jgi:hypothetical protein
MNASDANVSAAPPPGAPPARLETPSGGFTMAETTAIAMLASSAVGAILGLIVVTCVLVAVTKQLARLVRVLRGEASVHTGLLASSAPPPPDAFAVPPNGGAPSPNAMLNSKSILKKPIARVPPAKKSRHPKTDENNTSCAIAEVDEEEDHTL